MVPFVFAFYPELLLIEAAILDPNAGGGNGFLPGYDGAFHLMPFVVLLARLVLALYLLSSALAAFDRGPLASWEIALRLALAAMVMTSVSGIFIVGIIAALALLVIHSRATPRPQGA